MVTPEKSLQFVLSSSDFVEFKDAADLTIDLRYASTNNFASKNLYGSFNRAFLHKYTADKLEKARTELRRRKPGYKFVILDALRPASIQQVLWEIVKGTEGEKYFARPELGSLHSFGFAVDLTIADTIGRELDMGAGFDDFRLIAQPKYEEKFLAEGLLNNKHLENRKLLRSLMEGAGFIQLPNEWWHYDALPKADVRAKYQIVE